MKILIIESTLVNYGDDRGGVHEDSSNLIDVPKDQARKLTEANRALYVEAADDPYKDRRYSASEDMIKAAKAMAKAKKKPAPTDPVDPSGADQNGEGQ